MSGLATDRWARVALAAALLSAVALTLVRFWAEYAEAPELWWRTRWTLGFAVVAVACAAVCIALAWPRRKMAARAVPLLAAAVVLIAIVVGAS